MSNRNGNAGRPFHKCIVYKKFLGFADDRGNNPNNPPCGCGVSSKAQVAGRESGNPGGLHYVCKLGICDFYAVDLGEDQRQVTLDDEMGNLLARLRLV